MGKEEDKALSDAKTAEAANTAAVSSEAQLAAQKALLQEAVNLAMRNAREETTRALESTLKSVFGESDAKDPEQMRLLIRRVPILCTNITAMHDDIADIKDMLKNGFVRRESFDGIAGSVEELKDNQKWVVRLVLGAVIAAVLGLVLIAK